MPVFRRGVEFGAFASSFLVRGGPVEKVASNLFFVIKDIFIFYPGLEESSLSECSSTITSLGPSLANSKSSLLSDANDIFNFD